MADQQKGCPLYVYHRTNNDARRIVDADLSTFSYDSDELREISMTIAYDYAECEIKTGNRSVDPVKYFQ